MEHHQVVSQDEWIAARKALLTKEKALTHQFDELNAERLKLPWVRIEKQYSFDTPEGHRTLGDLFDNRSQLLVYHFMFAPDWKEGCTGCSFFADHVDGPNLHIAHHDISFVAVSRASLPVLEAYKKRMGWRFKWVSSAGSDFNFDFHVSFREEELASGQVYYNYEMTKATTEDLHGMSALYRDDNGVIFHTYSSYGRGDERGLGAYMLLDISPKGRNETGPNGNLTDWVHRHDQYQDGKRS